MLGVLKVEWWTYQCEPWTFGFKARLLHLDISVNPRGAFGQLRGGPGNNKGPNIFLDNSRVGHFCF